MPLNLTPDVVAAQHGRAKYERLAGALTAAIGDGFLVPNEHLPSEETIAKDAGVSKSVVRQAMDRLVRDGLIERRNGVPAKVTAPDRVRVISDARYTEEDQLIRAGLEATDSAFTRGHGIGWDRYTIDLHVQEEHATPKDSELLRIPLDAPLYRRTFVKFVDGEPVEYQRSAIPDDIAADCPWMIDPGRQPYRGGTQRELADGGHRVDQVTQRIKARAATGQEKRDLAIPEVTVLEARRVFWSDGRPVEASRVILDARRHELYYVTRL